MRARALVALALGIVFGSLAAPSDAQTDSGLRAFVNLPNPAEVGPDPNVPEGEEDFDWSFCRKKIRIAFYMQPPFIIVDPKMCKADPTDATAALLCPPEAFGDKLSTDNKTQPMFDGGGGLTFELLTKSVAPYLESLCNPNKQLKFNMSAGNTSNATDPDPESDIPEPLEVVPESIRNGANYKRVELNWYLLPSEATSADAALALLCNGGWTADASRSKLDTQNPMCASLTSYKGLSEQVCVCVCVCVNVFVYIYMYACVYVNVCVREWCFTRKSARAITRQIRPAGNRFLT
jgi:hypothetical protein